MPHNFYVLFELAFLSVLLFQLLFIVIQSYYIRSKEYYYYASYIFLMIAYTVSQAKAAQYLPLQMDLPQQVLNLLDKPVIALTFFVYFRFARYFMDLPAQHPEFNSRAKVFERVAFAYACIECFWLLIFGESALEESVFIITTALLMFFSLSMIIRFLRMQHIALTRYILAGAFFLLLGSSGTLILFNLIRFQIIPDSSLPIFPYQVGILAELLVFTTGLASKQRLSAHQKLKAEKALVRELLENEALQQNLQTLRNKIAADLHDDIGATLGSINVYAGVSKRMLHEGNTTEAGDYLNRIVELSKHTMKDMRSMIWALDPANDTIGDLEMRMKDYAAPLLTSAHIELIFQVEDALRSRKISVLQKRNLFLIFKEAMHNIIKHSGCSKVTISIQAVEDKVGIYIADNGKGFDAGTVTSGNGLSNIKRRATEMHNTCTISSGAGGTTIQLIV